ncbi:MAG: hypothetical protein K8H89_11485 [Flavobacteriales bacterium]|nr:hypothetical protein [Flavobacteriales bacterium]
MNEKFLELEREGIACQYDTLHELLKEHYTRMSSLFHGDVRIGKAQWGHMSAERRDLTHSWAKGNGWNLNIQGPPYGVTYDIAQHQLNHSIMAPHEVTVKEADWHNERERERASPAWPPFFINAGDIEFRTDAENMVKSSAEAVGMQWVKLYCAEVRELLGNDPDVEQVTAFDGLRNRVRTFEIGTLEGAPLMERLKGEAKGHAAMDAFGRIRDHLNSELDQIAALHSPMGMTDHNATDGTPAPPIIWKGSVQVLAWLLRELAEKGWIAAPEHTSTNSRYTAGNINASKYAKAMAPHFANVNETTLGRELKPEGSTVPAQDVEEFKIPKRPE